MSAHAVYIYIYINPPHKLIKRFDMPNERSHTSQSINDGQFNSVAVCGAINRSPGVFFPDVFSGEMEKEDFAKSSGFSGRTEWRAQSAMTLTKGS